MIDPLDAVALDPFDLPEWLGTEAVAWTAETGLRGHLVRGTVRGAGAEVACDLVAVDEAAPAPVATDAVRVAAHLAWHRGEVHLVEREERLTLAVPGCGFDADRVLDALARLARAVGADADRYTVCLQLGRVAPRRGAER